MKRAVLLFLLLALVSLSAGASYRIQLTSGRVITADDKPVVKDDMAYFNRNGVYFYLPSNQVDLAASEKLNTAIVPDTMLLDSPAAKAATSDSKPVFVGEEQLEVIRNRSRLANEGQLRGVPAETAPAPAGGAGAHPPTVHGQSDQRGEAQGQLNGLLQKQAGYQQEQTSLQNQLNVLRDSYGQAVQNADKESIQQQIDSLSSQLQDVQNNLTATQADISQTQQQLSSTPIVVESGAPPSSGTQSPPPKTNAEGPGT